MQSVLFLLVGLFILCSTTEVKAETYDITCSSGTCARYNGENITSLMKEDTYAGIPSYMARGLLIDSSKMSSAWFNLISTNTEFNYNSSYNFTFDVISTSLNSDIDSVNLNNVSCSIDRNTSGSSFLHIECKNVPGKYDGHNLFRVNISFSNTINHGGTTVLGFTRAWNIIQSQENQLNDIKKQNDEAEKTRKGILQTIKDLPVNIINGLVNSIKNLFIPDGAELNQIIEDFKAAMSEKLGAIYQVFDYIVSIFNTILNNNSAGNSCLTFPGMTDPVFKYRLWEDQELCFSSYREDFSTLFTISDTILSIIFTLLVINMLYKKLDAFFGGVNSDY